MSDTNENVQNVAAPRTVDGYLAEAQAAENHARAMLAQAAMLADAIEQARKPKQPEVGSDTPAYVVFTKYMSGREYAYAAVGWRQGHSIRWSITGQAGIRYTWTSLLRFIGEANWSSLHLVNDTVRIGPPPGEEPPVVEVMGSFGTVKGTYPVTDTGPGSYGPRVGPHGDYDDCYPGDHIGHY